MNDLVRDFEISLDLRRAGETGWKRERFFTARPIADVEHALSTLYLCGALRNHDHVRNVQVIRTTHGNGAHE